MSSQTGTRSATTSHVNATAVAAGNTIDLDQVYSNPICVVATNGAVAGGVVAFEGSLDGITWYTIATSGALTTADIALTAAAGVVIPARYVRSNITTLVTGGTVTTSMGAGA